MTFFRQVQGNQRSRHFKAGSLACGLLLFTGWMPVAAAPGQRSPRIFFDERQPAPVRGIALSAGAHAVSREERRVAMLLRDLLHEHTGDSLPILELADPVREDAKGLIVVGRAAERSLPAVSGDGGYAYETQADRAFLAGREPGGLVCGAWALAASWLGTTWVAPGVGEPPPVRCERMVLAPCLAVRNPAYTVREVMKGEALGYSGSDCIADGHVLGDLHVQVHTADAFINAKHYGDHPEYFARQPDGTRRVVDRNVHHCYSNPEVQRIYREKTLAWMRATPDARYYYITPGDGGGLYCRCEACLLRDPKPGTVTDRYLEFVNGVAGAVAQVFPEKRLLALAYLDTEEPPLRVRPAPNVRVVYCPYQFNWINQLDANDEANAEGWRTLRGWVGSCASQLLIFDYPSSSAQGFLSTFPATSAIVEKLRFCHAQGIREGYLLCGLYTYPTDNGHPGWLNQFSDLERAVLGRLLWEPELDVAAEEARFATLYYGAAAVPMLAYRELVHSSVRSQNASLYTDQEKRLSLVTPEFRAAAAALFERAEKDVADNARFLERVRREKLVLLYTDLSENNPGTMNLSEPELASCGQRLVELARLAADRQLKLLVGWRPESTHDWLRRNFFIRITTPEWYRDPELQRFCDDPERVIPPARGHAIPDGWELEWQDIGGGCPSREFLSIPRGSSGYGRAVAWLSVPEKPLGKARLALDATRADRHTQLEVRVNGTIVYHGQAPTGKSWQIEIPKSSLNVGLNQVEIFNRTADRVELDDAERAQKNEPQVPLTLRSRLFHPQNYLGWGWIRVSGLRLEVLK